MTSERAELYGLIEQFPDSYIRTLKDSLILTLKGLQVQESERYLASFPMDDEPTTDEDRAIFIERQNEASFSFDEVKKELGL